MAWICTSTYIFNMNEGAPGCKSTQHSRLVLDFNVEKLLIVIKSYWDASGLMNNIYESFCEFYIWCCINWICQSSVSLDRGAVPQSSKIFFHYFPMEIKNRVKWPLWRQQCAVIVDAKAAWWCIEWAIKRLLHAQLVLQCALLFSFMSWERVKRHRGARQLAI